jgi:hypothetical protein
LDVLLLKPAKFLKEIDLASVNRALLDLLERDSITDHTSIKVKALSVFALELQAQAKDEASIKELFDFVVSRSLR